jgi:glycosyltransferase involved in cell wall biosynthesis
MMMPIRLAVYASHPIQYQAPIFRELNKLSEINLTVLYGDNIGLEEIYNSEFEVSFKWDIPLMEGYKFGFFRNFSLSRVRGFFSRVNPGIFFHILTGTYEVVLIHGYHTLTSWLVFIAAKLRGVKIIMRGEAIPKDRTRNFRSRISQRLAKWILSCCDAVMYSCSGNKQYWEQLNVPHKKMFFIPCAVDNEYFRAQHRLLEGKTEELKKKVGASADDFVVLFSARFTERKRPLDLINAVAQIDHEEIFLLFVGDGPERKLMEELVKSHGMKSKFTGFINQSLLSEYYSIANLFVVISSYDASPKALNEALNFGMPVICSEAVGTVHDLVVDGVNGFVVGVGDMNKISQKLKDLNCDRPLARDMGKKSMEFVESWNLKNDAQGILNAANYCIRQE